MSGPLTPRRLKELCLEQNAAVEDFPFGPEVSVFKVAGKMFALSDLAADPLKVSLKCDPDEAVRLRAEYPAIVPGYHLNKRHWNTVTVPEAPGPHGPGARRGFLRPRRRRPAEGGAAPSGPALSPCAPGRAPRPRGAATGARRAGPGRELCSSHD